MMLQQSRYAAEETELTTQEKSIRHGHSSTLYSGRAAVDAGTRDVLVKVLTEDGGDWRL